MDSLKSHRDNRSSQKCAELKLLIKIKELIKLKNSYNPHPLILCPIVFIRRFLKRVSSIVPRELSCECNQHFSKWRMDIEEEGSVDVPTSHFSEVGLIPAKKLKLKSGS